ncbi:MAG TPA: hypothetical protein VIX82_10700 [Solirubrobacteraceae bacterium]
MVPGHALDQAAFDATTFTKNRQRLLAHEVADEFFAAVVRPAKLRRYISSDHFSVDGTLLDALSLSCSHGLLLSRERTRCADGVAPICS